MISSLARYRGDAGAVAARTARLMFIASVLVFAAHNIEELCGIQHWAREAGPVAARLYARFDRVLVAIALLTLIYAAVVAWATNAWRPAAVLVMLLGFSTIVANGLVHIVTRVIFGSTFPGWMTAMILVIPMGMLIFGRLLRDKQLAWWQVLALVGTGMLLQAPLALLALNVARIVV